MRKFLPFILIPSFVFVLISFFSINSKGAFADPASHVVVSEVQISGDTEGFASTDEFVELYNPTDNPVSLEGWELYKKTQAADAEELLVATLSGQIPANGFFLIAHENFNGSTSADITYSSQAFSDDNSIILKDSENNVVDLLGLGDASLNETQTAQAPVANRSLERKASSTSTSESMSIGGQDEFLGNSEDSDNNFNDFVRHLAPVISNPQNSSSSTESLVEPTPTEEPTATPTQTPTPTEEPTPTDDPEPTQEPTPTTEPSPTPTPSKIRIIGYFPLSRTVCYIDYSRGVFVFPRISCVKI